MGPQRDPRLNLTSQGYFGQPSRKLARPTNPLSLELYPPSYVVIDLSRFLIHLIPDFTAVPAFEKQIRPRAFLL
jgi:hypothetical protein